MNADISTVVFPRKLLKRFIQLYEELPCLWDKNCIAYKLKKKRHEAVTKLTQLVQEYDPSATRVHVLRKIESLRACVRREYKKVQESRRAANCEDEVYTPHLWYYDLFSFIFKDSDMNEYKIKEQNSPKEKSESEGEEELEDEERPAFESSMDNLSEYTPSHMVDIPGTSNLKRCYTSSYEDERKRHCTEVDDEYDAIGVNVAAKLRSLAPHTRILAEKLINDVLFQAQTNSLTTATAITTPDPFK